MNEYVPGGPVPQQDPNQTEAPVQPEPPAAPPAQEAVQPPVPPPAPYALLLFYLTAGLDYSAMYQHWQWAMPMSR